MRQVLLSEPSLESRAFEMDHAESSWADGLRSSSAVFSALWLSVLNKENPLSPLSSSCHLLPPCGDAGV